MNIYLDTLGCRLNQAEIETMARQFRAAGHVIVAGADDADLAVVNTCAVTSEAASDSRGKIRKLALAGGVEIVTTGCWATLEPEVAAGLPMVSRVVTNPHKDRLVAEVLGRAPSPFDLEPLARVPLAGARRRTRAFIKVQDGCDNQCTFCVTTVARGASRSRRPADIMLDVRSALEGGSKEVVLTGVHLASWGKEFDQSLTNLVRAILRETHIMRLRLSSLEPWDLDPGFFSLWEDPRLCRHLHLPLQSGCRATLRRMRRNTSPELFEDLLIAARARSPELAITTDIIAGFPGETDAEFCESIDFVRRMRFAGGHAFSFSARPGTAAARMRGQVPDGVRRERTHAYRALFEEAGWTYRGKFLGRSASVLWESAVPWPGGGWRMQGLTDTYVRVTARAPQSRWNHVDRVQLTGAAPGGLHGIIPKSG